jgi:hypothetical protein
VCNENSSCRLFWLCCILFVTDLDVWSGVWSVHRIYGIYILQCTMTILDLYRSCRTWLFTNVLISWRWFYLMLMHYIYFFLTFTLCQIQCSVKVKANSVGSKLINVEKWHTELARPLCSCGQPVDITNWLVERSIDQNTKDISKMTQ